MRAFVGYANVRICYLVNKPKPAYVAVTSYWCTFDGHLSSTGNWNCNSGYRSFSCISGGSHSGGKAERTASLRLVDSRCLTGYQPFTGRGDNSALIRKWLSDSVHMRAKM